MSAIPEDPAVAAFVAAVNGGNRDAFFSVLSPDATMSDDGSERDLAAWVDREIFSAGGRMDVESASDQGRALTATFTNTTYGAMRTHWVFTVSGGRISHFETGQA